MDREIFEYWKRVFNKNNNVRLTAERRKKIKARLQEGYSIEDIKTAIEGCSRSDFHMKKGEYKLRPGPIYNDLVLILRSGSKLEQFMQIGIDYKESQKALMKEFKVNRPVETHEQKQRKKVAAQTGISEAFNVLGIKNE